MPEGLDVPRGATAAALTAIAAKHAGSYPVQMGAGQAPAAAGARDDAIAAFERAAELVPSAVGASSPRAQIAVLAERAGDFPRALRELKALVGDDHTNIEAARRRLVPSPRRLGDQASPRARLRSHRHTSTRSIPPRTRRTAAWRGSGATWRSPCGSSGPPSTPARSTRFRRSAISRKRCSPSGERAEAKQAVLAALEAAPTYERAQQLPASHRRGQAGMNAEAGAGNQAAFDELLPARVRASCDGSPRARCGARSPGARFRRRPWCTRRICGC